MNIFLIGPMGAGKSTIGRILADELNCVFYDSDKVIEERSGANIPWIFDVEGEQGFRDRETLIVDQLTQLENVVIATGGGVVSRLENRKNLMSRGVVVFLHASVEQQLARTGCDRNRPLLQNDHPGEVLQKLFSEREPLYVSCADIIIKTDKRHPRWVVKEILRQLKCVDAFI